MGLKDLLQEKRGKEEGAKLAAKYLDPVRREAAMKAAATRKAAGGDGESGKGGEPPASGGQGGGPDDRRERRARQLSHMSDNEFAGEVRDFQNAQWRESRLQAHARDHRDDFLRILGKALKPEELDELSRTVLRLWDRLFTGLGTDDSIAYDFAANWTNRGDIIVTVVRGKVIRTMLPFRMLSDWLGDHPQLIEVTARARRLGL